MGRYGFTSPGGMAGNAIQQFLMQREMLARQQQMDALRQKAEADDVRQRDEQLQLQRQEAERIAARQRQMDAETADARAMAERQRQNEVGVRGMMADGMSQGLTPETAKTIGIMAFREGMDTPPDVQRMLTPPKRTTVRTSDGQGHPIQKAVTEDELIAGVPEYREPKTPERGPAPNYLTLVSPDGKQQQRVADGQSANALMQQGWHLFDAVAARNTNTADPNEAKQLTEAALAQAKRLKSHPGFRKAYGAYEMRGFTQDARDAKSIRDQLVASLALPNLGALKGPMSDKDLMFIKSISTRLADDNISDAEAGIAVDEAIKFLESKTGGAAPAAPAGGGSSFRVVGVR